MLDPLLAAPAALFALLTPPPSDCKEGGSGGEPAGGAAGPPRHRPDGPEAVTLLGATGTPACSGIPPGGRCATLTGITPPSTTPFTLSSNSRRPDDRGTSAGISRPETLLPSFFSIIADLSLSSSKDFDSTRLSTVPLSLFSFFFFFFSLLPSRGA